MTFTQLGMRLPLFGITYAVTGIASGAWWLRRVGSWVLPALSGVIIAIAALNAYVEGWRVVGLARPEYTVSFLLAIFLLPYAMLSIRLMQQMEGMSWRAAVWSTWIPFVCLLFLGLGMALGRQGSTDDLPLTLFMGVTLICVLHVPMFAYGKGGVVKIMRNSGIPNAGTPKLSPGVLKQAAVALGMPLLVTLGIQIATRDDWRPLCVNVAMTAAILSLFLLSRK